MPERNGYHVANDIYKRILQSEQYRIFIKNST